MLSYRNLSISVVNTLVLCWGDFYTLQTQERLCGKELIFSRASLQLMFEIATEQYAD